MKNVLLADFGGNVHVGLFGKANDEACFLGCRLPSKTYENVRRVLRVEVHRVKVCESELVGMFVAFNKNGVLLPKVCEERDVRFFKDLGFNVCVLRESRLTALGNLILCNDKGAVVSRLFTRKEVKVIEDCLDVEVVASKIAGTDVPGAVGIATNRGCLLHRDAKEEEVELVREALKVKSVDVGTVNFGSVYVGSDTIANSEGAVVGRLTTGFEMDNLVRALGLA